LKNPDVVIAGAGIMGASCAWHLARRGLRVLVAEMDVAPAMGSTGRSAADVRVQRIPETTFSPNETTVIRAKSATMRVSAPPSCPSRAVSTRSLER